MSVSNFTPISDSANLLGNAVKVVGSRPSEILNHPDANTLGLQLLMERMEQLNRVGPNVLPTLKQPGLKDFASLLPAGYDPVGSVARVMQATPQTDIQAVRDLMKSGSIKQGLKPTP